MISAQFPLQVTCRQHGEAIAYADGRQETADRRIALGKNVARAVLQSDRSRGVDHNGSGVPGCPGAHADKSGVDQQVVDIDDYVPGVTDCERVERIK